MLKLNCKNKIEQINNRQETEISSVLSMTCRSPLIHARWIQSFNRFSIKTSLDLEPAWDNEPLQTSIPLEFLFTTPVRWAQTSNNRNRGSSTISLEELHEILFSKPSRERQLPRVTSWWRLLEVSLMPQSSNSWCNALGSSHTLKSAISKQVCVREGCLSSIVSSMQSKSPKERPDGRALGIYRHPFKN